MSDSGSPRNLTGLRARLSQRCLQLASALFIVGLMLGLLAAWGERRAAANITWRDPADTIHPASIAPDLTVLGLAGVHDSQVLALAMEMHELETTHALLALGVDLRDGQRMNGWLWLALRYQEAGQTQRASQANCLAGNGAILGADLPVLSRTTTLLAVGRGLIPLHDKPRARFYLGQAALLAARAPQLSPYQRRTLLEQLVPAIVQAGGKREDWNALAKTVERGSDGARGTAFFQPTTPAGTGQSAAGRANDAALIAARNTRQTAAAAWLGISANASGESPSGVGQEVRQALRQALLNEDAAVHQYVARSEATPESTTAAQEILLRWLLLKRLIAAGGVGVGLVPEWESSRNEINATLTAAWADWLALEKDTADHDAGGTFSGLPAPAAHRAIMAAYWGLYPDARVADLLPAAQPGHGFGGLRLTVLEPGTPPVVGWSE
jgi:hypothetical protein